MARPGAILRSCNIIGCCLIGSTLALINGGADGRMPPEPSSGTTELLQQQLNTDTESRQNNILHYANNFGSYYASNNRPQNNFYQMKPNGYDPIYPAYRPYPTYSVNQNYGLRPTSNYPYPGQQQSLMNVLESVADNDRLQCVSKILCEMASGNTKQGYTKPISFPYNVLNLDSLLTLLSSVDDRSASPLVKFGKAFVLGYTSRHTGSCQYAYPHCPSDPDRLVHYLNNNNGGLFQFFNGANFLQQPVRFQRRIQTRKEKSENHHRPNDIGNTVAFNIYDYDESEDKRQYGWRFPAYDVKIHNYGNDDSRGHSHRTEKSVTFPDEKQPDYTQNLLPLYFPDRATGGDGNGGGSTAWRLLPEKFQTDTNNDIFVFRNYK